MLGGHGRYDYVPISRRAGYSWPGGASGWLSTSGSISNISPLVKGWAQSLPPAGPSLTS